MLRPCRQVAAATEAVFFCYQVRLFLLRCLGTWQVLRDPAVAVKLAACLLAAGDVGSSGVRVPLCGASHEYSNWPEHPKCGGMAQVAAGWGAQQGEGKNVRTGSGRAVLSRSS